MMKRIVLAYSGDLETSLAIPWLIEQHGAEVVALTLDLGQGRELEDARDRALALGAVRAHVLDACDEFARDIILPSLQAGALLDGTRPLPAALSRPLIAKHVVDIARLESARAIAHGCAGTDREPSRLDIALRAIAPGLEVIAPARVRGLTRSRAIEDARARGIPVPATASGLYAIDANLWGRTIEDHSSDGIRQELPGEICTLTPDSSPDRPACVEIDFDQGVPVAINGVAMGLVELIESIGTIAGGHGVGRLATPRGISEAPAAVALHVAHRGVQNLVTPSDLQRLTADLARTYASLVEAGEWFSPTRNAVDALVASVQHRVTGSTRLELFKGQCRVVSCRSPFAGAGGTAPQDQVQTAAARQ